MILVYLQFEKNLKNCYSQPMGQKLQVLVDDRQEKAQNMK